MATRARAPRPVAVVLEAISCRLRLATGTRRAVPSLAIPAPLAELVDGFRVLPPRAARQGAALVTRPRPGSHRVQELPPGLSRLTSPAGWISCRESSRAVGSRHAAHSR